MKIGLKIGTTREVSIDLNKLRVSHALVQGASGAGKSYLLRVIAEQLPQHIQTIIIDPEGEYATLREKVPYVLVGKDGDTPARIDTAELLAERLVTLGASAVCDLYSLEREDQQEWVRLFISKLMRLPKALWKPLIVILDEAHLYAPEKGEGNSVSTRVVEDFCSRGRKHGIGIILATQRIAKLSNNAASEMQNNFVGRTFLQSDREKAAKVMGVPKRAAEMEKFYAELKVLDPGDFWCLGVAVSLERIAFHVQKAITTHPEPGTQAAHRPAPPDQVKALLAELADLPQEAAEQEEATEALRETITEQDVRIGDLRREVLDLSRQLEEKQKPTVMLPNVNGIREKLETFDRTNDFDARLEEVCANLRFRLTQLTKGIEEELQKFENPKVGDLILGEFYHQPDESTKTMCNPTKIVGDQVAHRAAKQPVTNVTDVTNVTKRNLSDTKEFSGGAVKLISALLTFPNGISRSQARTLCGFADRTLTNYVSELSTAGMVIKEGANLRLYNDIRPTLLKKYGAASTPRTTRAVLDLWQPKLSGGAFKVLAILVNHRGNSIARDAVRRETGMAERTLTNYVSELSSAKLLVRTQNGIAANKETLFL